MKSLDGVAGGASKLRFFSVLLTSCGRLYQSKKLRTIQQNKKGNLMGIKEAAVELMFPSR